MKQSLVLCALVSLALAVPAAAQPAPAGGAQSVSIGGQWAYPTTSGTELDGSPGLKGSWRGWITPHFGVEAQVGWWTKGMSEEYRDSAYQVSVHGRMHAWNIGANILGAIPVGRATTIVLGGGPGMFHENAGGTVTVNGASQTSSAGQNHFGLQSVMEVDVRASSHVSIFGGMHAELRDVRESDSGVLYPVAGVRFAF